MKIPSANKYTTWYVKSMSGSVLKEKKPIAEPPQKEKGDSA